MKPYFAKRLPIEGEIKKDDWFQRPDGVIKQAHKDFEPIKGLTKVKLFLCSRDIQVGDRYKSPRFAGANEFIDCERYASEPMEGSFKVIGEILTPGIIENQEFTEKEAEFLTIGEIIP
ncbi:MAG: hypothetical protein ACEQSQ_05995 [Candidatus Paceibacteria bacterium]